MNTDTTEPAKSLGQVAFEGYSPADIRLLEWDDRSGNMKKYWEAAAQAVIQQFLSAGPVRAEDVHEACIATGFMAPARVNAEIMADKFNAIIARHANPVQAEGGEWRELVKGEIIESGDAWFNGDVYEYATDLIGEVYADNIRPKVLRRRIPTVQPAVASGSPKDSIVPQEPKQAVVADGVRPSVIYREGRPSAEDYTDAIDMLIGARQQLAPDGENCACCGDSGHQAWECHHNPLVMARKAAKQEFEYRCWHCGYVARSQEQGDGHFGKNEEGCPACKRPTSAPESASATVAQEGPSGNPPTAAQEQGGTQKERDGVEVAAYRREVEKWKANYVEVHDQLTASQARVARVEAGNKSMLKAIAIRDKELAQADEATAKYRQVWQETEARLNDARDQCRKVTADLEAMKVRAEKEHSEQLHLISLREKQLMETSESVDEFQKENAALSAQSAEHVRQITMDAGTIKRLQDVGFESDLKVQELEKEITALRQERDRSDQDWANAKKECESLRFRLTEANRVLAQVGRLRDERDQWKEWHDGAVVEKGLIADARDKAHTGLSQVTAERDKAIAEVAQTHREYDEIKRLYDLSQLRNRGGALTVEQVRVAILNSIDGFVKVSNITAQKVADELNASLQSPWRTIIAGDPASLPQIGDADRNGNVEWLRNDDEIFMRKWSIKLGPLELTSYTHWRHTNLPPLPTPRASAEDDGIAPMDWRIKYCPHLDGAQATAAWQAARASQTVEGRRCERET